MSENARLTDEVELGVHVRAPRSRWLPPPSTLRGGAGELGDRGRLVQDEQAEQQARADAGNRRLHARWRRFDARSKRPAVANVVIARTVTTGPMHPRAADTLRAHTYQSRASSSSSRSCGARPPGLSSWCCRATAST